MFPKDLDLKTVFASPEYQAAWIRRERLFAKENKISNRLNTYYWNLRDAPTTECAGKVARLAAAFATASTVRREFEDALCRGEIPE